LKALLTVDSVLKNIDQPLGEEDFLEPLELLLSDLKNEANLNTFGSIGIRQNIINKLQERAKLYALVNQESLPPPSMPLVITGLPRSGTTFLLDLLHCDSGHRGPLTWEIFHPLPLATTKRQIKSRIRRTNFDLRMIRTAVPDFDIMHPLHAELPEECQLITTFDLRSINYAYMARVPNYENYIKTCNFSSAMLWHSRFLRALEKNNKPDTWLLKDPWHIQHIPEFLSTYPKACFVFIHRNPTEVIPSISSLSAHLRFGFSKHVDKNEIGLNSVSFWSHAMEKCLLDRAQIPENQRFDIHFADLVSDPMRQVRQMYSHFGLELTEENKDNMHHFLTEAAANKALSHKYTLEEFGLTEKQVGEGFKEYTTQFDL